MLNWLRPKTTTDKSWSLADASPELLALFSGGASTSAGVSVGPESALRVPAVACAVRVVAEAVALLPIVVYERGSNGDRQRATTHPAYGLLHDAPNDWQSSFDLKLQLQIDALLHGDGLAFVNRVRNDVREILRLVPGEMSITVGDDGGPVYRDKAGKTYPRDQVIHIRGLSTDGVRGKSTVRLAAEAIGIALQQERHAGLLFGSGGRPSGVLKLPGKLGKEAVKRIAESWARAHSGENAGRTAVLEEGGDFQPLTFNSVDLQFLELRKFQLEEIARAFRVPPHLLFELGRATWSNMEDMDRAFLTYSLLPWLEQWQGAIQRTMFTREERSRYFAEFLVDDFNRADTAKRWDAYSKAIAARVLNPNEVRARENLPPYVGGDEFVNPNITGTSQQGGTP
jgi:HK97 family phage portal protein